MQTLVKTTLHIEISGHFSEKTIVKKDMSTCIINDKQWHLPNLLKQNS